MAIANEALDGLGRLPYKWFFADMATMVAEKGLANQDINKLAFLDDSSSFYSLVGINTDGTGWWIAIHQAGISTQNIAYTIVTGDINTVLRHNEVTARTWTVAPDSTLLASNGAIITIINTTGSGNITLAQGSGVTIQRGDGTAGTGSRTIGPDAVCSIIKTSANTWYISGKFT